MSLATPLSLARTSGAYPARDPVVPDSFWLSLRYFNLYRIGVAAIFLFSMALLHGELLTLGSHNPTLYLVTAFFYLALAVVYQVALSRHRRDFNVQLSIHVVTDIVAVTLLMYASGGFRSGLAVMLLVSLAAAALMSRGTLMFFFAALASIAILLEQGVWVLLYDQHVSAFVQPGLLSIGYFATAFITSLLAQRVITNERVARKRGLDLANQLRINQLVIQDVQDGVMVVDSNGLVRQCNPAVEALLGGPAPELEQVEVYSKDLAAALEAWRERTGPRVATLTMPGSGKAARARFVEAGVEGDRFTLVYLDDQSKLEDQSRQLKLAALGRLTANIAHEIRNPLAAIMHAAELLAEENRQPGRDRLNRIIRDNAARLDRMVKDVLELNRRDRVQAEPLRLSGFLANFIEEFAHTERLPAGSLALHIETDDTVEMDRVHLNQILWNLVRNAWRHSKQEPGSVRVVASRQGTRTEVAVIDDGPGVDKALQSQLFEPFFTTYSGGTGLGLYIARELCNANGAALEYVDRAQGGAFRIVWRGGKA